MAFKRQKFGYLDLDKFRKQLQKAEAEVKRVRWKLYQITENINWIVNIHDECVISGFDDTGSTFCMECPHNNECPFS